LNVRWSGVAHALRRALRLWAIDLVSSYEFAFMPGRLGNYSSGPNTTVRPSNRLFVIPVDREEMARHYILAPDDRMLIGAKRRVSRTACAKSGSNAVPPIS
jgi:hypothetical protein